MNFLVVIPARGGSKGIPRKNVRLMNGKPLISYSINNALNSIYDLDVVVSSDDEEIKRVSSSYGAQTLDRPDRLATDEVTLDPVIFHAVQTMESENRKKYDIVITMQATSPLLNQETLDNAIRYFIENDFDTVLSGFNNPHLSWTEKDGKTVPNYKERLNRQYLPKNLMETGAFFISKREFVHENGRFGPSVSVFEISEKEAIDIDIPQDWWIAEKELSKKNILLRIDGYKEIGLGHIYRGLLLAYNFIDHNIKFVLSEKSDSGIEKIKGSFFPYEVIESNGEITRIIEDFGCDILVNDILDTPEEYVKLCQSTGVRVVNFEDLGEGTKHADAVINDLYEKKNDYDNHFWGSDYYCIRDEFQLVKPSEFRKEVKEVLVLFGGTDPSNLTKKVFESLTLIDQKDVHYTFIVGMGYAFKEELENEVMRSGRNIDIVQDVKRMSDYMRRADIALSSQGRTMLELASMSVPTILMAQNDRELHHEFGYMQNGFINLGLGEEVERETIKQTVIWLMNSPQIRKQMKEQMEKKDLKKGIERVKKIILNEKM